MLIDTCKHLVELECAVEVSNKENKYVCKLCNEEQVLGKIIFKNLFLAKLVVAKVNGFKAKPLTDHEEYKELYNLRGRAPMDFNCFQKGFEIAN